MEVSHPFQGTRKGWVLRDDGFPVTFLPDSSSPLPCGVGSASSQGTNPRPCLGPSPPLLVCASTLQPDFNRF